MEYDEYYCLFVCNIPHAFANLFYSQLYCFWNPNCENTRSQFLAILRLPLEWVHRDVQTYSIQSTTKVILLNGIGYLLEEQP